MIDRQDMEISGAANLSGLLSNRFDFNSFGHSGQSPVIRSASLWTRSLPAACWLAVINSSSTLHFSRTVRTPCAVARTSQA